MPGKPPVRLEDRPLTDELCVCGCGEYARKGSEYNSVQCRIRYNSDKRVYSDVCPVWADTIPEHVAPDVYTWEQRRASIRAKYGVNQH